jgi:heptaprenyl diphosphate synthase
LTPPPGETPPGRTLVLLGALCLFLSTLEYLIPKPLPFIRIGLANLPLLLALDLLSPRRFALLTLIKITGAGVLGGTIFSYVFLFSLGGGIASSLIMYGLGLLRRAGPRFLRPGLAGIGAAGALSSTAVQLLLARFLIFGEGVRYLIPPFLAAALITGFALGLFCEYFLGRSQGPAEIGDAEFPPAPPQAENRREQRRRLRRGRWDQCFVNSDLIIAGCIALPLFLFNPSTWGRAGQFLLFWFGAWASGKKNRPLLTLSIIAGVVFVNLLAPYGRVLAEIGPLSITAGSLDGGLRKGLTLEGLLMLSSAVIRGRAAAGMSGGPAAQAPSAGADRSRIGRVYRRIRGGIAAFCRLLAGSLAAFTVLDEGRRFIRPGCFIEDLERLLRDTLDNPPQDDAVRSPENKAPSRRNRGRALLALGILTAAAFTVLPVFFG